MIDIQNLHVRRRESTLCQIETLHIAHGERVAICGPNGCGKTTLLRVLSGLTTDYSGECRIAVPPRDRVYVHQAPYMLRGNVLSNITYGLRARGLRSKAADMIAISMLEQLGIAKLSLKQASVLSGGERRRVALGRALVLAPSLLLLDEPFADTDVEGNQAITSLLENEPAMTVLIASPSPVPDGIVTRTIPLQSATHMG